MSAKMKCRHCGATVRFVIGRWVHSWHNWQTPLCTADGTRYGQPTGQTAEPEKEDDHG
jgi:hypothetical protein